MNLLGTPLLVLLAVLAVALPGSALLVWSRMRGPRGVRAAQRSGLLVASQLAAVALVAAALNDYGDFYGSWGNLFHGQPQSVHISPIVGHAHNDPVPHRVDQGSASAGTISHRIDPTAAGPAQWPAQGRLESIDITGASSRLLEHSYVYLPPQYFQPGFANSRFPAMEVLTGYPGDDTQLLNSADTMRYPAVLLSLIEQHKAQPTVLVMLRPSVDYPRDTECTNVPAGPQAETFYADDVPSQIAHDYRVRTTGWGAIGTATGGYCSAKLAMLNSRVFYAAVSIQGYYTALKDGKTGDLWGGSAVLRNLNNLEWRLQHIPPPPVSIMAVGSLEQGGPNGYQDAERFASMVTEPMRVQKIIYPHGKHTVAAWRVGLSAELAWLSAKLPNVQASR